MLNDLVSSAYLPRLFLSRTHVNLLKDELEIFEPLAVITWGRIARACHQFNQITEAAK
jgi:hypothetical protein